MGALARARDALRAGAWLLDVAMGVACEEFARCFEGEWRERLEPEPTKVEPTQPLHRSPVETDVWGGEWVSVDGPAVWNRVEARPGRS